MRLMHGIFTVHVFFRNKRLSATIINHTKKFTRTQGTVMLLLYLVYVVLTVLGVDKLASMF